MTYFAFIETPVALSVLNLSLTNPRQFISSLCIYLELNVYSEIVQEPRFLAANLHLT